MTSSSAWILEIASFGAESSSPRRTPRTTTGTSIFQFLGEFLVRLWECNQLNLTHCIFEARLSVHLTGALRLGYFEPSDNTRNLNLILRFFVAAAAEGLWLRLHFDCSSSVDDLHVAQLFAVLIEWMTRDEEAKNFFFVLQSRVLIPLRHIRQRVFAIGSGTAGAIVEDAEESMLAGCSVALRFLGELHRLIQSRGNLRSATEGVHGTSLDERFEDALIQQAKINTSHRTPTSLRSQSSLPPPALRAP